jgi:pentatricopeptide repeat protein
MKMLLQTMAESFMNMVGIPNTTTDVAELLPSPNVTVADLDVGYEVLVLPMKSPVVLRAFLAQHEDIAHDYLLKCLRLAVIRQLDDVILFQLGESEYLAIIDYEDYGDTLTMMLDYYVKKERFDKASECHELLTRHKIEKIITESQCMVAE